MADLDVRIVVSGDVGTLSWNSPGSRDMPGSWQGADTPESMIASIAAATEEALLGRGLRRLEVALPAGDRVGRRAVLRAGFRVEGVRREAHVRSDGSFDDVVVFARLAADLVGGPTGFSGVMNSALPRKRLIAHVLMRAQDGRVLLCETQFKADWELPGGIVEPGESPRLGAAREVTEELGVEWPVGRLLVVDWLPPYLGWEDAVELIFDGGTVGEADLALFELQPAEIRSIRLCTLAEAADLVTPLAHRRLTIAAGLSPGETAYLEDGAPPG